MNQSSTYMLVKHIDYFKNGIILDLQDSISNRETRQYIRIATLNVPNALPFTQTTNNKKYRIQEMLNANQDRFSLSSISINNYSTIANKLRQSIPVQFPGVPTLRFNVHISDWQMKRNAKLVKKNFQTLLDQGIEIFFCQVKGRKVQRRFLIILCEYGPQFSMNTTDKDILHRPSVLDLFPALVKFNKFIQVNENGIIHPIRTIIKNHPQAILFSSLVPHSLIAYTQADPNSNNPINNLIKQHFDVSSDLFDQFLVARVQDNYHPEFHGISERQSSQRFLVLKRNREMIVEADKVDFVQFLLAFSFLDSQINRDIQVSSISNDPTVTIVFSRNDFPGFLRIEPEKIQLNLLQLKSEKKIQKFFYIFRAIDLIYGENYTSSQSAFKRIITEIKEFDKNKLSKISKSSELLDLLAAQLTNQSFIGDPRAISKIFQMIRQVKTIKILDSSDVQLRSGLLDKNSNLHYLPPYSLIDTSDLLAEDMLFILFSTIVKILDTPTGKTQHGNITLVFDDDRIERLIVLPQIQKLLTSLMEAYPSIRIIYHSTHPRFAYNQYKTPRLRLNVPSNDNPNKLISQLKLGKNQIINVRCLRIEKSQLLRIRQNEFARYQDVFKNKNPLVIPKNWYPIEDETHTKMEGRQC